MKEPRIPYVTNQRAPYRASVQIDLSLLESQVEDVQRLQTELEDARLNRNQTIWKLIGRVPRASIARIAGMSQQGLFKVVNSSERYQYHKENTHD